MEAVHHGAASCRPSPDGGTPGPPPSTRVLARPTPGQEARNATGDEDDVQVQEMTIERAPGGGRRAEPEVQAALRASVLASLDVVDSPADAELDAVVRLAARLTGMPLATVTVLGAERQYALAAHGSSAACTPAEESLCARAIRIGGVFASADLAADPRFRDSPWVDGRRDDLRVYVAAPLTVDGAVVGTLCVADRARPDAAQAITPDTLLALDDLAGIVVALLERRREQRAGHLARQVLADLNAELAETNQALEQARAFDRAMLETLPVGIVAADAGRRLRLFNGVSRLWHGEDRDATVEPGHLTERYDLFDADGTTPLAADRVPLLRVFEEGKLSGVEMVIAPHGLPARRVSCSGQPVFAADGELLGAVVAMADISAQRELEDALRSAALHDGLTGLPNRGLVRDRISHSLAATGRGGGRIAVLYCDLDGFKAVNDTYGHATGDEVLVETAARLLAAVRPGDTVARMGGDEFVLCCTDVGGPEAAAPDRRPGRAGLRSGRVHRDRRPPGGHQRRLGDEHADQLRRPAPRRRRPGHVRAQGPAPGRGRRATPARRIVGWRRRSLRAQPVVEGAPPCPVPSSR